MRLVYADPMARPARKTPRELTPDGWPEVTSPDPVAEVARQFALNLREAVGEQSLRGASARIGVDHSTLVRILAGEAWPDLATIARIEIGLGVAVYPGPIGR